jgi:uncharacterized protein DUF5947
MTGGMDSTAIDERIEALTAALDSSADAQTRAMAKELVSLVLQLHKHGLEEFVSAVEDNDAAKRRLLDRPIVRSLLALHDVTFSSPAPLIQIARRSSSSASELSVPAGHVSACGGCGANLTAEHRHIIDLQSRIIACRCRACWLLAGSGQGSHERGIPTRYLRKDDAGFSASEWDALKIPVDVAFFMINSAAGRTFAFYPSPAGPTESALSLEAWHAIIERHRWVRELTPDVEAVLVRRRRETGTYIGFIVPIDACYELVGRIRLAWSGFTGGTAVQDVVDAFFAEVLERCEPSDAAAAHAQP